MTYAIAVCTVMDRGTVRNV